MSKAKHLSDLLERSSLDNLGKKPSSPTRGKEGKLKVRQLILPSTHKGDPSWNKEKIEDTTDLDVDVAESLVFLLGSLSEEEINEPANIIKSFADKAGKSKKEVERLWNKAKILAAESGQSGDYPYIVGILKQMLSGA